MFTNTGSICLQYMMYRKKGIITHIATYSFFILCIQFHVARMHTKFLPKLPAPHERLNRTALDHGLLTYGTHAATDRRKYFLGNQYPLLPKVLCRKVRGQGGGGLAIFWRKEIFCVCVCVLCCVFIYICRCIHWIYIHTHYTYSLFSLQ
jgi:hypothetical protein